MSAEGWLDIPVRGDGESGNCREGGLLGMLISDERFGRERWERRLGG